MREPLSIAVAQPRSVPYDVTDNVAIHASVIRSAEARVVVFQVLREAPPSPACGRYSPRERGEKVTPPVPRLDRVIPDAPARPVAHHDDRGSPGPHRALARRRAPPAPPPRRPRDAPSPPRPTTGADAG